MFLITEDTIECVNRCFEFFTNHGATFEFLYRSYKKCHKKL